MILTKDRGTMAKEAVKKTKPRRPTPLKRDLQNEKRRLLNKSFKSTVRTSVRAFDEALAKGDAALIKQQLDAVYSMMDKGVKRGVYKLNKASRTKARLAVRAAAKA
ncbi:MAG TPA: 30S ribosomal protein S20 [Parachlamydiaceae bacterium]|nr:30S ribosomal protein S20 [Parachlamydiaceae bacterium]